MSDSTVSEDAIVIERVFDAPTDIVWGMWTEPDHFKNWYGPQGFSIPLAEIELTVGGKRMVCMESPDGTMKMCTTGEHLEVTPTSRLVYTESMADADGNVMPMGEGNPGRTEVTVILEDVDGRTKMVLTHAGVPADSPGATGWNQAFDKLTDYVGTVVKG
ncbi:MAG: SRPBCC domain-containing protein [Chloroflexi bacterium]|nr:MAG: SRPBCC domain-containing protein [Chloroflexota bacterium]MBL1194362.1 SRPBCC domain-containing protein [Chloroflexota bacterium]NOH11650.1 SRPBCC domain-containing protein [Chloroflexota bacterium]